ncbi:MAG: A24 family peptidase [Endomicrobium sp.]|jgi:leader peptidase (prepilin peptidase)/N-methyltransferase|nr:A24 family peptidase [Endomicrobium sp.]
MIKLIYKMTFYILGIILVFYIGFKIGNTIYKTFFIKCLTALSLEFLFYKFSFSFQFLLFFLLVYSLILVSVIDYFHRIIPTLVSIGLIIVGFIFSFLNEILGEVYLVRYINCLLGIFAGGSTLFIIGFLGQLIYKKEVIGGGDINLMAGVGAFIGWERALIAIFLAAVFGSIIGLILIAIKKIERKDYIPFGPFLSTASFITIFLPQFPLLLNTFF